MSIFDSSNSVRPAMSQIKGGISFTDPTFSTTGQQSINGGYSFDLPLATVAAFNERALTFSANNTENAQGFLQGVLGNSQAHVTRTADRSFDFGSQGLATIERINTSQQSTIQNVAKRMFSGGCFITTAICKDQGKPDDCDELTILRKYRDEILLPSYVGKQAVQEYYAIAPAIVKAIDAMGEEKASAIYTFLNAVYLQKAIVHIRNGDHFSALDTYTEMVRVARTISGV